MEETVYVNYRCELCGGPGLVPLEVMVKAMDSGKSICHSDTRMCHNYQRWIVSRPLYREEPIEQAANQ